MQALDHLFPLLEACASGERRGASRHAVTRAEADAEEGRGKEVGEDLVHSIKPVMASP